MIEFVTLFLGLTAGQQRVDLAAGPEVAEVRLLVDRQEVALDTEPPWQLEIDLGPTIAPHLLEAVAYDTEGSELARSEQTLNLPRPPAEARVTLERDATGTVVAARTSWESAVAYSPRTARAWLDGEPLEVDDPERIPIPPHDASDFHLFSIELDFSSNTIAQSQAVFGGAYLDQSRTDLTAFPVVVGRKDIAASQMTGWFLRKGDALRVSAIDRGSLDLVLVRGPGVAAAVQELEGTIGQGVTSGGSVAGGVASVGDLGNVSNAGVASAADRLRRIMALESGQRLRILTTQARVQSGHTVEMASFAMSPEITNDHGGLYWALRQEIQLPGLSPEIRLADSVAVAALQAANGNRRRGVLLVLAARAEDESRHTAAQVRSYLQSIQVPLFVWRMGEAALSGWEEWGEGRTIANFRQLQGSARHLKDALDRQRIIWLDGHHLPNEIAISPSAKVTRVSEG